MEPAEEEQTDLRYNSVAWWADITAAVLGVGGKPESEKARLV